MSAPIDLDALLDRLVATEAALRAAVEALYVMRALDELVPLRSQLSQVTRERDEAREEAARVRLLGESDSRELLKAETSRDAAEATLREARIAWAAYRKMPDPSCDQWGGDADSVPPEFLAWQAEQDRAVDTLSRLLGEEGK